MLNIYQDRNKANGEKAVEDSNQQDAPEDEADTVYDSLLPSSASISEVDSKGRENQKDSVDSICEEVAVEHRQILIRGEC